MKEIPKKIHFLLVEDDENHAEIVKRSLKKARVENQLDWVQDGEMAMNYLNRLNGFENVTTPDIVILDLNLPKKNGHQVLKEIKQNDDFKNIPVVVLTTSSADKDRAMAYEERANSYLIKPLDFETFKVLVDDLSFYWGNWNSSDKSD